MAEDNKRKADARKAAMERTRVRVIAAGRREQNQHKQQERLAKQEQKMAEKLARQQEKEQAKQEAAKRPPKPVREAPAPEAEPAAKAVSKPAGGKAAKPKAKQTIKAGTREKTEIQVIRGGRGKKLVRWISTVAVLAVAAVVLNTLIPVGIPEYVQNMLAGAGTGDGFPVEVAASDTNTILSVGSDVALLGDSSLLLYKANGKQIADRQHGFSNPAFCACSARVLVYDRGGKGLRMENRAKTLFTLETEGTITTAAIADNGGFAVVTRSGDYIADVTAYSAGGKQQFVWHSSSRQVTAVSLSDDGRYMAVGALHVEGGEAVTSMMLFDTKKGITLWEEAVSGSLLVSLDCKGSATVAVLTDRAVSFTKTGEKIEYPFEGGTLTCFDNTVSYGTVLVLGMYQDTRNNRLLVLDKHLQLLGQAELQQVTLGVSAKGSAVHILLDGSVAFYNRKGVLRGTQTLNADAKMLLCKNGRAVTLGSDRLEEVYMQ